MTTKTINPSREKRRGPIPLVDPRTHCVSVRLNDNELQKLDNQRGRMARGEYLRCAALDELPPTIPALNQQAWVELSKAAGNLNQIAKKLNSIENADLLDTDIKLIMLELAEFRTRLLKAQESDDDGNG